MAASAAALSSDAVASTSAASLAADAAAEVSEAASALHALLSLLCHPGLAVRLHDIRVEESLVCEE